jgi:hypothetical protein
MAKQYGEEKARTDGGTAKFYTPGFLIAERFPAYSA